MRSSQKPNIVVTGPDSGGFTAWIFTAMQIRLAGGQPIRVTPSRYTSSLNFDGVVLGGGSDIHPSRYQAPPNEAVHRSTWLKIKEAFCYPMEFFSQWTKGGYDEPRDAMEIDVIEKAIREKKPILAICRGHQLLNAYLGGTIAQSTLPLLKGKMRIRSPFARKIVKQTKATSVLRQLIPSTRFRVNAIHSQAVVNPGESMRITAIERSGIIQAVESDNDQPIVSVQWHPEYLLYLKNHRSLFEWLIKKAQHEAE
ncbi:gamma-glutamyl-gamma-aminobutyrate hydrolase family protein [Alteromonas oceanisediminis]|uniref:gamma-glutamyl-gamma-aminobutyrate hydrolase family protein n=1 Tax=Alteromonas oceanisediminis TaxID=2836180 RepID=UPI001BDB2949|nr:gamma-glutamyl-gamma-aminobutyrate hydrolase family protein [Alteromonas oceanisediminis]MBT0584815.1 gamma-glutamyl-gamma-aminobutyrate hydrolase family protein [Alteromonas oceanisediminis]